MRLPHRFLFAGITAVLLSAALPAQDVLFVGNSFTNRPRTGIGTVNQLNGKPAGAVPGLFQLLATSSGKNPQVYEETMDGKGLAFHYDKKRPLVDRSWDIVVLQDSSTGPLIENNDRTSYESFRAQVGKFQALFTSHNPEVVIWLYETWARPDRVDKGLTPSLEAMQAGLHRAYSEAARDFALAGYAPVGDAFLTAVQQGLADNPATPEKEASLDLWGKDRYHQSAHGAYLAALIFYGRIYDADPRKLSPENPAAHAVQASVETSQILQKLAWEQLQTARAVP